MEIEPRSVTGHDGRAAMRAHLRPSVTDDVLLWKVLCRRFCGKTRKLYRGAPPRAALRQTHTAPKLAARFIWRREPATRPPTSPPRYAKHPPRDDVGQTPSPRRRLRYSASNKTSEWLESGFLGVI